jgi:hypothetical protein
MDKRHRSHPADLSVPVRVLFFCVARGTEWAEAGVTGAAASSSVTLPVG